MRRTWRSMACVSSALRSPSPPRWSPCTRQDCSSTALSRACPFPTPPLSATSTSSPRMRTSTCPPVRSRTWPWMSRSFSRGTCSGSYGSTDWTRSSCGGQGRTWGTRLWRCASMAPSMCVSRRTRPATGPRRTCRKPSFPSGLPSPKRPTTASCGSLSASRRAQASTRPQPQQLSTRTRVCRMASPTCSGGGSMGRTETCLTRCMSSCLWWRWRWVTRC
mmetsp:Transcript_47964/g.116800  ORF Transcript_47964/g.116800 Transcript_47964/m.116800 type:complete len:219 (+) Transcript_47964:644-1300(+)